MPVIVVGCPSARFESLNVNTKVDVGLAYRHEPGFILQQLSCSRESPIDKLL